MTNNENTTVDTAAPEQPESPEGSSAATGGYTATREGEDERFALRHTFPPSARGFLVEPGHTITSNPAVPTPPVGNGRT